MTSTRPVFTRHDYDQLPEGFPCELIEGDLVREPSPAYRHQRVVFRLARRIAEKIGDDRVVCSPIDVVLDNLSVLHPDVAVFSAPLSADVERVPLPALVIEVLCRSTAERDRKRKTRLYLAHGVPEVWLVHPVDGTIEACMRASRSTHPVDTLVASAAVPEVTVRGRDLLG